jgi:hypothetical protein
MKRLLRRRHWKNVSIPPGFEREVSELQKLDEVARTDPGLQKDRIAIIERLLRRLPPGEYKGFQAAVLNDLGVAYTKFPAGDRAANLRQAIGCHTEALRFPPPRPPQRTTARPLSILPLFTSQRAGGSMPTTPTPRPSRPVISPTRPAPQRPGGRRNWAKRDRLSPTTPIAWPTWAGSPRQWNGWKEDGPGHWPRP